MVPAGYRAARAHMTATDAAQVRLAAALGDVFGQVVDLDPWPTSAAVSVSSRTRLWSLLIPSPSLARNKSAGTSQTHCVVKQFAHGRGFAQELAAYRTWVPSLPRGTTPELVAVVERERALVLTRVGGEPPRRNSLLRTLATYHRAGAWLKTLHQQHFCDRDELPLEQALTARARHALERVADTLEPATRTQLEVWSGRTMLFRDAHRSRCHRDFGPHNWLVDISGRCIVLDFEHSRPDAPQADFVKLVAGPWCDAHHLEDAFWQGYGQPEAQDRAKLHWYMILHALGTLAWTAGGREPARERHARWILGRYLDGPP